MPGEPKQIISFNASRQLQLNKVVLDSILNQEHVRELPIAVLSVVGAYRTGKSFLLSWIIRFFKSQTKDSNWLSNYHEAESLRDGFEWRSGSEAHTEGIWAWSEVFVLNSSTGGKVCVLLVDTQGLFDEDTTTSQNSNIFTLSTLMSSIQIYNLKTQLQEDHLDKLHLFSEFGRIALSKGSSTNVNAAASKPFQRLVFLVRDWPHGNTEGEPPFGSDGGKAFIQKKLKPTQGQMGNELGVRRQYIRDCFSEVDCYLMPEPGRKVNGAKDFNGRLSDMDEDFKEHLGKFVCCLFPGGTGIKPKTVMGNGRPVLASNFSRYVQAWVEQLNTDKNLSSRSIFETTFKIGNFTAMREALEIYKKAVGAFEADQGSFLSADELAEIHEKFKKKALNHFEENRMGHAESNAGADKYLNQLKKAIEDELGNWKTRNEVKRVNYEKARLENEMRVREAESRAREKELKRKEKIERERREAAEENMRISEAESRVREKELKWKEKIERERREAIEESMRISEAESQVREKELRWKEQRARERRDAAEEKLREKERQERRERRSATEEQQQCAPSKVQPASQKVIVKVEPTPPTQEGSIWGSIWRIIQHIGTGSGVREGHEYDQNYRDDSPAC